MAGEFAPVARGLYVCESYTGRPGGRVDLAGVLHTVVLSPDPDEIPKIVLFALLSDAVGSVPTFVDVRRADTGELIHTTGIHIIDFPDRNTVIQFAMTLIHSRFAVPGVYFFELICDNTYVCETRVTIRQPEV